MGENQTVDKDMITVILARKNRKHLQEYGEYLCKRHHLDGTVFLLLKGWCGIVARCAKIPLLPLLLFKSVVLLSSFLFIDVTV